MAYNPNFRGSQAAAAKQVQSNYMNGSGSTILKGSAVSVSTIGSISPINIQSDDSVSRFLGLTTVDLPNAASGGVVPVGRIENVTTSFAVGDALYLGPTGALSNIKPDYGVNGHSAGDYVIFIGVVVKNEFNSSLKDLQINVTVVGQL